MPLTSSPWTITATREAYRNPWITVVEHDVVRPDGEPGLYGVVHARLACGVLPITDDGQIVLVGQWRFAFDAWSWEIPEGGADPGEDGLAAMKRELREETGYVAQTWEDLGSEIHLSNSHSSETARLWVATDLAQVGAAPDGDEVLEVRHVDVDEALRMVDEGEITDAMSVIALLRWARAAAQR